MSSLNRNMDLAHKLRNHLAVGTIAIYDRRGREIPAAVVSFTATEQGVEIGLDNVTIVDVRGEADHTSGQPGHYRNARSYTAPRR